MKILALEFSSDERSVAIVEGNASRLPRPVHGSATILGSAREAGGRETRAFAMIESALNQAQLKPDQIECLAVGLGPGSYTGIRIAISIAQGWQLARNVKLLGINSVECIAEMATQAGFSGSFTVAVDAHRSEFYVADFALAQDGLKMQSPLQIVASQEVKARLAKGNHFAGPGLQQFFPEAHDLYPSAEILGILAADRSDFVSGEQLEPIYLRETAFVKAPPPRIIP